MTTADHPSAETTFARHLHVQMTRALRAIPKDARDDVYVVSLGLEPEVPDERRVIATLGWNTVTYLRERQASVGPGARRSCEWSRYGFVQPSAAVIADSKADPTGSDLRYAWLQELGLWYPDQLADVAVTEWDPEIWDRFVALVVNLVSALHKSGELGDIVGHSVPVLLDAPILDEEEGTELNRSANPSEFYDDLDRWSARGLLDG